jgi:hypothetical protein
MKPPIAFAVILGVLVVVVIAIWSHDVWSDRSRTVVVRTATPIFTGIGEGCAGTRMTIASPNATFQVKRIRYWKSCTTIDVVLLDGRKGHILLGEGDVSLSAPAVPAPNSENPIENHRPLAVVALFCCFSFVIAAWVCSLIILRKMRFDSFGISDLWSLNPWDNLYIRYIQEAKRRNWSMLPVYIPATLGTVFFCCFVVLVVLGLRQALN